jgi:hypothetical protein
MIRYKRKITIRETNYGLKLESDRGSVYELSAIKPGTVDAPITSWWDKQAQTDLRRDQLDCIIKEYWRQYNPLELFLVYKKGEGYSQPHDIMLVRDPVKNVWILSTQNHTWFEIASGEITFDVDDALGPISNLDSRLDIYEVIDGLQDVKNAYTSIS